MSGNGAAGEQPATFAFTPENLEKAQAILAKYPKGRERSGVLPLLDLAQRQQGWVSHAAIEEVGRLTGTPRMRVLEVATFYTMYKLSPKGRHHIEVCTNLPCWLRGSDEILRAVRDELGIEVGGETDDGLFSLAEAECLGACVNAPMLQIGDDYYEDLTYETVRELVRKLKVGEPVTPGSQSGRQGACPEGGPTTLKSFCTADKAGGSV
ncbi:NAD(P)H-dependent oxidoreductase subunit E [Rhodospirillum rubrum]|uniref:complex I 24 kDa subunit family protein n=1 Tax=Rhodospirillum rubrum TaxID=1085 RepID=UPI001906A64B|nr:NAD(P)H-dependent oxidoreductase subunit E [Rhodospirillum rubrum]MBK1663321.1 NAD(P)H-dependent oxidoreductase subunit E [Rhodospirillum rubrum]MBK1675132.1 NAD(P)H-dependent oxidoreductase subunit E [Rhodospirillum rubrum]